MLSDNVIRAILNVLWTIFITIVNTIRELAAWFYAGDTDCIAIGKTVMVLFTIIYITYLAPVAFYVPEARTKTWARVIGLYVWAMFWLIIFTDISNYILES